MLVAKRYKLNTSSKARAKLSSAQTTQNFNHHPENVDQQWGVIKSALFPGVDEVVGHIPKQRYQTWLTAET